eukprot:TRINITY_DN31994_c0_g1_i1.p1 TRINITY_DN31994_c0_g1~~TRINITY_DN31994_c0_g1_i1.p1  ORF type:complete len:480 (-),score=92.28 TRINITY_DN31994_c0_g1_i1:48-1385(-)
MAIAYQGRQQAAHGFVSPNEEDRKSPPGAANGTTDALMEEGDTPEVAWEVVRAKRIVGNDTENIPYALVVSIPFVCLYALHGYAFPSAIMIAFTLCRIIHSVCFAFGLQPFRTLFFFIGFLLVSLMSVAALFVIPETMPVAGTVSIVVMVVLDIKLHVLVLSIPFLRKKHAAATLPDDVKMVRGTVKQGSEYPEILQRIDRCHQNDVENLPMGILATFVFAAQAPPDGTAGSTIGLILIIVFGAMRCLHTVAYMKGLQPWRSLSYFVGTLCVVVMLVWSIIRSFELPEGVTAGIATAYLQTFNIVYTILYIKVIAVALLTGARRSAAAVVLSPEDTALTPNATVTQKSELPDSVARVMRAHQNDVENIPLFLFLGVLFRPSSESYLRGGIALFIIFTVFRLLHTCCYLNKLQPWRSLSWVGGLLTSLVLAILCVVTADMFPAIPF